MFGIAATNGRMERRTARRPSVWTRDRLRDVALADLGCAVVGVFMAAQLRFAIFSYAVNLQLSRGLGKDGQPFRMHRFRRITAAGTHLRRWSVDELPQLFNVFLGRMSLVGSQPTCDTSGAY